MKQTLAFGGLRCKRYVAAAVEALRGFGRVQAAHDLAPIVACVFRGNRHAANLREALGVGNISHKNVGADRANRHVQPYVVAPAIKFALFLIVRAR